LARTLPGLALQYLRLFWGYAGWRIFVIVALTLAMSWAEGLGIVLLFPLFDAGGGAAPNAASDAILRLFRVIHVQPSPGGALPVIVLLFAAKGLLLYVTTTYQLRLSQQVTRRMRRNTLDALARAEYQHVAGTSAGFFTNLLITEVNRAAGGFLYFVRSIPPALSAAVLFTMVLLLDWKLSVVCVAMGLVLIGLTRLSGIVVRRYSLRVSAQSSRLTSLVVQLIHAFKYLRATAAYERFDRRIWETSDDLLEADYRASAAGAFLTAISQPLMVLFLGGILYYRAAVQGEKIASLFVVLLYFLRVMTEVFSLQSAWQSFFGYIGSVELLREATAATQRAAERVGTAPFRGLGQALACDHVVFSYGEGAPVLHDITLSIPRHATVAFVGESGSGKSTLVDLLVGTLTASRGAVRLDGVDLTELDREAMRRRVGYVPQDAVLFDDTVAANIALWSSEYSTAQVREAAERARCLGFIEAMPGGFETQIGDRGVKLSGGQRQRIAIARELLRTPEILVLDEATSALDSESEVAIQQSIDQLKGRMTILIIAHRLSTVRNADRIYVLHEGRIVEEGSFSALLALPDGRFRRMCELQEVGV
jgi:subfamily B ATP-binding cassette protein MsbA